MLVEFMNNQKSFYAAMCWLIAEQQKSPMRGFFLTALVQQKLNLLQMRPLELC